MGHACAPVCGVVRRVRAVGIKEHDFQGQDLRRGAGMGHGDRKEAHC